jgi:hypothetical protein
MKHRSALLIAPLILVAACGSPASGTAGGAGRAVARESAAREAAKAATEANRQGTEVVMRPGERELRAPAGAVEADGVRLISPYVDPNITPTQIYILVDAACKVNDLVELGRTDDPSEAARQIAAMRGVQAASVLGLAGDIHEAKSSRDVARVLMTYALCQYAGERA